MPHASCVVTALPSADVIGPCLLVCPQASASGGVAFPTQRNAGSSRVVVGTAVGPVVRNVRRCVRACQHTDALRRVRTHAQGRQAQSVKQGWPMSNILGYVIDRLRTNGVCRRGLLLLAAGSFAPTSGASLTRDSDALAFVEFVPDANCGGGGGDASVCTFALCQFGDLRLRTKAARSAGDHDDCSGLGISCLR
jgi:hypothetical protein